MTLPVLLSILIASAPFTHGIGDFVDSVVCTARGMDVILKQNLPTPRGGNWDLEVDGFPKCPGATKNDVGGGYQFTILYADKDWCGVSAQSLVTPAWVSFAKVVLLIKDDNGTVIADSVSCIYDTRFETSLLTFRGEITSQNLMYGGSLAEEGADIESTVYSSEAVSMDFYDQVGRPLQQRHVQLGDPIMFRIDVSKNDRVSKVLPENCYFSSSSMPEEAPINGQTLPFVKKSCFNNKDGMVRAFLPKMDRNNNGTTFEMRFPAFHFTEHGQNLFVHCTILACVANQQLCEPRHECFGTSRRRRSAGHHAMSVDVGQTKSSEVIMTKYIIVEDKRNKLGAVQNDRQRSVVGHRVCMEMTHFVAVVGSLVAVLLLLLVAASCLGGRICRHQQRNEWWMHKRMQYTDAYDAQPPTYTASLASLPTITSF